MATNLNISVLDELVEIMGEDMDMLLTSYIKDSQSKLDKLLIMNADTEQESIFRMAHSLKGSSRNVGVVAFSDYCEVIENLARSNQLKSAEFDTGKLKELFEQAISELSEKFLA